RASRSAIATTGRRPSCRPARCSSSSGRARTPIGWKAWSSATPAASSAPESTSHRRASGPPGGRSNVHRSGSRRAFPACSRPGTCGTGRSRAALLPAGRGPWRCSTSISTWRDRSAVDVATAKEFLRRQPLFESLSDDEIDRLHRMAATIELPEGHFLMREGEPGDAMFVVLDGDLEVSRRDGAAGEVIAVRAPGEVLGEMALLPRQARTATVRALAPARVLRISSDAYEELLAHNPHASRAIVTTVMQRLRSAESMLMQREK